MVSLSDVNRVAELLHGLESRLDDSVTPQSAARDAAWSLAHFHRKFKWVTGDTFLAYLRGRRLQRAADGLLDTRLEIQRIAWDAGFAHVPAFHNAFIRCYGRTPALYRARGEDLWPQGREALKPEFLFHVHEGRIDREPEIVAEPGRVCLGVTASGPWSEFDDLFRRVNEDLERMNASPGRILCQVQASLRQTLARELTLQVGVEIGRTPHRPEHWEAFTVPPGLCAEFRHHGGTYASSCFHIWRHWPGRDILDPAGGHTVEMDWDGTNPFSGRRSLVMRVRIRPDPSAP